MDRRDFIESLSRWMVAVAAAVPQASHLTGSDERTASGERQPSAERGGVVAGPVKFPATGVTLEGYLARPVGRGPHPAVLLIPANNGLDDGVREVARCYANEGFVALAGDPLSRQGGTACFASPAAARAALDSLSSGQLATDLEAAFGYLQSHPFVLKADIAITDLSQDGRKALLHAASGPDQKGAAGLPQY